MFSLKAWSCASSVPREPGVVFGTRVSWHWALWGGPLEKPLFLLSLWKEFRCWNPACGDGAETREFTGSLMNGSSLEWAFEGACVWAKLEMFCLCKVRSGGKTRFLFGLWACEGALQIYQSWLFLTRSGWRLAMHKVCDEGWKNHRKKNPHRRKKGIPKTSTWVPEINHQAGRIWVSTFSKTEFLETRVFSLITRNMQQHA